MIGLPAGTRIWIAEGVTDLRRGFTGARKIHLATGNERNGGSDARVAVDVA
jgi:hypothetical protein